MLLIQWFSLYVFGIYCVNLNNRFTKIKKFILERTLQWGYTWHGNLWVHSVRLRQGEVSKPKWIWYKLFWSNEPWLQRSITRTEEGQVWTGSGWADITIGVFWYKVVVLERLWYFLWGVCAEDSLLHNLSSLFFCFLVRIWHKWLHTDSDSFHSYMKLTQYN